MTWVTSNSCNFSRSCATSAEETRRPLVATPTVLSGLMSRQKPGTELALGLSTTSPFAVLDSTNYRMASVETREYTPRHILYVQGCLRKPTCCPAGVVTTVSTAFNLRVSAKPLTSDKNAMNTVNQFRCPPSPVTTPATPFSTQKVFICL